MTRDFRQKLLNWLTSVGIVLLASALATMTFWMVQMPTEFFDYSTGNAVNIAGPLGETLLVYPALMIPVLSWHFFDFIQRVPPRYTFFAYASSYATFAIAVSLAGIVTALIGSRIFFRNCGWERCDHPASEWLTLSFWILATLLAALCVGKAAVAIHSRRTAEG